MRTKHVQSESPQPPKSPARQSRLPILLLLSALLAVGTAAGKDSYAKDTQVRLKRDTSLNFQDKSLRTGKAGETFTVLQYNPATKRVYMLGTGADGKPVAINVPEDSLEVIGPDLVKIATSVEELCGKKDFAGAKKLAESVSAANPGNDVLQQLGGAVTALATAESRLAKAKQAGVAAAQRTKTLTRNADLAARPNQLRPNDRSGDDRAQALTKEAEELAQTTQAENDSAAAGQADADTALKSLIAQLKGLQGATTAEVRSPSRDTNHGSAVPGMEREKSAAEQAKEKAEEDKRTAEREKKQEYAASHITAANAESLMENLPEALDIAAQGGEFKVDKCYKLTGPVMQMTEEFILVKNLATEKPLGILFFGDPAKVGNVSVDSGMMIEAVARFKKFKDIPLKSGSKRTAVYDCVGFRTVGGKYVDTSASSKESPLK